MHHIVQSARQLSYSLNLLLSPDTEEVGQLDPASIQTILVKLSWPQNVAVLEDILHVKTILHSTSLGIRTMRQIKIVCVKDQGLGTTLCPIFILK